MLSVSSEAAARPQLHLVPLHRAGACVRACACASKERRAFQFPAATVGQETWLSPWECLYGSRHLGRVIISAAEPTVPYSIYPCGIFQWSRHWAMECTTRLLPSAAASRSQSPLRPRRAGRLTSSALRVHSASGRPHLGASASLNSAQPPPPGAGSETHPAPPPPPTPHCSVGRGDPSPAAAGTPHPPRPEPTWRPCWLQLRHGPRPAAGNARRLGCHRTCAVAAGGVVRVRFRPGSGSRRQREFNLCGRGGLRGFSARDRGSVQGVIGVCGIRGGVFWLVFTIQSLAFLLSSWKH